MRGEEATTGHMTDLSPTRRRSLQLDVDDVSILTKTLTSSGHQVSVRVEPCPTWEAARLRPLPIGSHISAMVTGDMLLEPCTRGDNCEGTTSPGEGEGQMRVRSNSDAAGMWATKKGQVHRLNSILKKSISTLNNNSKRRQSKPGLRVSFSEQVDTDIDDAIQSPTVGQSNKDGDDVEEEAATPPPVTMTTRRRHSCPLIQYTPPFRGGLFRPSQTGDVEEVTEDVDDIQASQGNNNEDVSKHGSPEESLQNTEDDNEVTCTVIHSFTPKKAHTRRTLPSIKHSESSPRHSVNRTTPVKTPVVDTTPGAIASGQRTTSPPRRLPPKHGQIMSVH